MFKAIVIGALLFSTAFAFSGLTGVAGADTTEEALQPSQGVSVAVSPGRQQGLFLSADVHEQAYLTFLVKEYALDSMTEWKEAFAERKKVNAEMKGKISLLIKDAPGVPGEEISVDGDMRIKYFVVRSAGANDDGSTPPLPLNKEIITVLKDGVATGSQEQKDIIFKAGEFVSAKPDQQLLERFKAEAELQEAFAKAVESEDAAAIGAVLPKILADYKENTEQLKKVPETIQLEVVDREEKSE